MSIDVIIKSVRKELAMTQEALARNLHVSFSTLNRWENRRVAPSQLAMVQLKDYCAKKGLSQEIIDELEKHR